MVRSMLTGGTQGFSRRAVLRSLGACALTAGLTSLPSDVWADAGQPLRAAAKGRGRKFGAAVSSDLLGKDAGYRELVRRECAVIVPEWEMKWYHIQKDPDRYDFSGCDRLAAFAAENRMELRGHTLVWHLGLPDWAKERLKTRQGNLLLRTWMSTLMTTEVPTCP